MAPAIDGAPGEIVGTAGLGQGDGIADADHGDEEETSESEKDEDSLHGKTWTRTQFAPAFFGIPGEKQSFSTFPEG